MNLSDEFSSMSNIAARQYHVERLLMEWEIEQRNARAVGCYSFHDSEANEIARHLVARGVVVLPADHPIRTGEPSPEMFFAAGKAFSDLDTPNHRALEAAVRAALAVIKEDLK